MSRPAAIDAREVARRALRRVDAAGGFASVALDDAFAASPLTDRDRALATELVYGVLRHRARIDRALDAAVTRGRLRVSARVRTALRVGVYQLLWLDRVPAHAAVDDAVAAVRRTGGARLAGLANAVLRRVARDGEPPLPEDPRQRVAVEHSLPEWIVDALAASVGDAEVPAAAAALAMPAPLVVRAVAPVDVVLDRLHSECPTARAVPVPGTRAAIAVEGLGAPSALPSFQAGLWTVQDVGSQRVVELVAPEPGQRILDACAGVGGKAAYLAQLAGGGAHVDAVDVSDAKLARLRETVARLGARGVHAVRADLTDPSAPIGDRYDLVLIDAPCSGLGVLRRHPEAKWRVTPGDVAALAGVQRRLLDALAPRADRALVYSVCTFTRQEGPDQVAAFLARHPGWRVEAEVATWPHRDGADAFYAARLARR